MSAPRYEAAWARVGAQDGLEIVVAGICEAGTRAYWQERFGQLETLGLHSAYDIYDVDEMLAGALSSLATDTLVMVGASAWAPDLEKTLGLSTGGVLGDPREENSSAQGECEVLENGFAVYTAPGGPGLAALAAPEELCQGAELGRGDFLLNGGRNWPLLLRHWGVDTGILVLDGTGGVPGCVSVFCGGEVHTLPVGREEPEQQEEKEGGEIP